MRDVLLALLFLVACHPAAGRPAAPAPTVVATADETYEAKQYARCAELFTATAERGGPDRASSYYNAACCYARDGKPDLAFAALELAIKTGFHDVGMHNDEDLASLHGDPRWEIVWHKVQAAFEAEANNVGDPALRRELLALVDEDQVVRKAFIADMQNSELRARVADIDRKTTSRLKEIVASRGWPGKTLVGEEAAHAAWLLIQHADADRDFQKQCLLLIEKAVAAGEATPADYAYLYDRVAVAEARPQRFGTQYGKDGKPAPIENEAHVDQRRRAVGLGTMAEYDAQMRAMYGKNLGGKK